MRRSGAGKGTVLGTWGRRRASSRGRRFGLQAQTAMINQRTTSTFKRRNSPLPLWTRHGLQPLEMRRAGAGVSARSPLPATVGACHRPPLLSPRPAEFPSPTPPGIGDERYPSAALRRPGRQTRPGMPLTLETARLADTWGMRRHVGRCHNAGRGMRVNRFGANSHRHTWG